MSRGTRLAALALGAALLAAAQQVSEKIQEAEILRSGSVGAILVPELYAYLTS